MPLGYRPQWNCQQECNNKHVVIDLRSFSTHIVKREFFWRTATSYHWRQSFMPQMSNKPRHVVDKHRQLVCGIIHPTSLLPAHNFPWSWLCVKLRATWTNPKATLERLFHNINQQKRKSTLHNGFHATPSAVDYVQERQCGRTVGYISLQDMTLDKAQVFPEGVTHSLEF